MASSKQPLAILRLGNGRSLEIVSQDALAALVKDSERYDVLLSGINKIWLYPMIVDFRKQLDGLVVLVVEALDKDPLSGDLFLNIKCPFAKRAKIFKQSYRKFSVSLRQECVIY